MSLYTLGDAAVFPIVSFSLSLLASDILKKTGVICCFKQQTTHLQNTKPSFNKDLIMSEELQIIHFNM